MNSLVSVKTEDNLQMNISLDVFPANIGLDFDKNQSNNSFISGEQFTQNPIQNNINNEHFVFGSNLFTKRRKTTKGKEVMMRDPKTPNSDKTVSLLQTPTPRTGRLQENLIHTYYDYSPENDKSVCKVIDCKREIKSKNSSNLMKHLQRFHKNLYKIYLNDEEMRKSKKMKAEESSSSSSSQQNISSSILMKKINKYYDENNPISKGFLLRLIRLVSMTSLSKSIVDLEKFRELIWFIDKRIPIPSSFELKNECKRYLSNAKQEIVDKIQISDMITLVADIINGNEEEEYFIRVSVYLWEKKEKVKNILTLGLRPFPKPHNSVTFVHQIQNFITEYHINCEKIIRVLTDDLDLFFTLKNSYLSYNRSDIKFEFNPNLFCTDFYENSFNQNVFDENESQLNLEFKKLIINRIASIVNLILSVIKSCETGSQFECLIKKVVKLMANIYESQKSIQLLNIDTKQTSIPTQWNLLYLLLKSFNHKKSDIESICLENNFEILLPEEWNLLKELIDLYKPFDELTIELSKANETTISKVMSSYLFLKHQLLIKSQNESGSESLKSMINRLTNEFEKRFNSILDPNNDNFNDGIYLASTFLDPRFARLLNYKQLETAKAFLREFYNRSVYKESQTIESPSEVSAEEQKSSFLSFMELELSRMSSKVIFTFDKQLIDWLHFISENRISLSTDPLDFWRTDSSTNSYLDLKNIALNLLCIPSTTVMIERLLPFVTNECFEHEISLSHKQLDRTLFLKSNAKYLKSLNFFV